MEINLAEGEAFNIQGGDGLKVNGEEVGGGGGSSVIVDETLTKDGENPVKSKGIWSAIWGAIAAPAASVYEWVTAELKKKQDKLKQGDNITIDEDGTISASGGSVDVVAEIAGKEIEPSAVIKSNNIRTVGSSADSPFYIDEETSYTYKECFLDLLLSDVSWRINAEEKDYAYSSGSYSGSEIYLSREKFENGEARSLEISVRNGTIYYAGPEGEIEVSIFDLLSSVVNNGGNGEDGGES